MARQAALSLPARKRWWAQIVRAKIEAQAELLVERCGHDNGLVMMSRRVRSGDPQNLEAQAARIYWRALFGPEFFRMRQAGDQNRLLNYGYAVLRALVARALCGAGLHPSLGLSHHNRYNPFCLADDLMEPFRPLVDRAVALWCETHSPDDPIDKETKTALLAPLLDRYRVRGEERTLFDILATAAAALTQAVLANRRSLDLPRLRNALAHRAKPARSVGEHDVGDGLDAS